MVILINIIRNVLWFKVMVYWLYSTYPSWRCIIDFPCKDCLTIMNSLTIILPKPVVFSSLKNIFQVFGYISKNISENIFKCLIAFLKMLLKTHFLLLFHIFSSHSNGNDHRPPKIRGISRASSWVADNGSGGWMFDR